MADQEQGDMVERIIEAGREGEERALEAVRKFLDTVDGVFPAGSDDGPRRKIIDSAFKMTEQVIGAGTQVAEKVVRVAGDALAQAKSKTTASK